MATAAAPATEAAAPTLYERIGGDAAVQAAVGIFYTKVISDPELTRFFNGVDMEKLKGHQVKFLTMVFGGPKNYSGRSMEVAHARLIQEHGLAAKHFDLVAGHLVATLVELGVAQSMVDEVVAIAGPLRSVFPDKA